MINKIFAYLTYILKDWTHKKEYVMAVNNFMATKTLDGIELTIINYHCRKWNQPPRFKTGPYSLSFTSG